MNGFYTELKKELEAAGDDIWAETILTGEHAGEKRLFHTCPDKKERAGYPEEVSGKTGHPAIFRERIGRIPKLVICGGGHVSIPIIHMGKMLGFRVTVIEDRPKFADHARAAGADSVICESFAGGLAQIQGDSDSWFIIVTRGHRYDQECLEAILKKRRAYVGMMGSRRRVAIVKDQLEKRGINREILDDVHAPIGLKIKAETPEEIAVSVMAEIIQARNSRGKSAGYSEEMLACIFEREGDRQEGARQKKVLSTIISRKGSAPRGIGTKMLILEDGSTIDTIGGGCVESEIIQKALVMMRTDTPQFQVCTVDMTADAAEDEGMVCGGVVEVMLERI